ncbi:TPA: EAL domain-containing protein [Legionella pneumophila]
MRKKNHPTSTMCIGLMTPYTGIASIYGHEIANAGMIACQQVNDAGGVLGKELELVIIDDSSMPEQAVRAANSLIDEYHCQAIIGNLLSNSRIDVANKVSLPRKVIHLNFSFYEGSIFNKYFFNFSALPNQQLQHLIPYLAHKYGLKFYFAGTNYEWPRGSIFAAKNYLSQLNGEVVGEDYFAFGEAKAKKIIANVAKSGANVFMPYFAGLDQVEIIKAFVDGGLREKIAMGLGHYDEAMMSYMPDMYRYGFYSSNTYFMSVQTPENQHLLQELSKLKTITGVWPQGNGILTHFGEGAYLCVKAFAIAINQAGTLNTEKIIMALSHVALKGPQGEVKMDPVTHHAHVNNYLAKSNQDGTLSIIKSYGSIPPVIPLRYRESVKITQSKPQHFYEEGAAFSSMVSLKQLDDFKIILDSMALCFIVTNSCGDIVSINTTACEAFGYEEVELKNRSLFLLTPPPQREIYKNKINKFLHSKEPDPIDAGNNAIFLGYTKNGSEFVLKGKFIKRRINKKIYLFVLLKDISQQIKEEENLVWQATHDPVTHLINKKLFHHRVIHALQRCQNGNKPISILYIDLEMINFISNIYGMWIEEKFLNEVGSRILSEIHFGDTLARVGDERFVVLCENNEDEALVLQLAEKIKDKLRMVFTFDQQKFFLSCTIGICHRLNKNDTVIDILRDAEVALYEAKRLGKNNIILFNSAIKKKVEDELMLATQLELAIDTKQLYFELQPIVTFNKSFLIGAEILLRWKLNNKEIPPSMFIPIAERSGAIYQIGYWVLEQGCNIVAEWQKKLKKGKVPYISINISMKQLEDAAFYEKVRKIIAKTKANPYNIVLEVTESALMEHEQAREVLYSLRKFGFRMAIDDFGTGYSSLKQLSAMPIDILKVDKYFIDNISKNKLSYSLVKKIVQMAHIFKTKIIIEGLERTEQYKLLAKIKPDAYQGFLFSPSVLQDDFEKQYLFKNS